MGATFEKIMKIGSKKVSGGGGLTSQSLIINKQLHVCVFPQKKVSGLCKDLNTFLAGYPAGYLAFLIIELRPPVCTWYKFVCTIGWVNFSEFEITVCGSCKMSQKLN